MSPAHFGPKKALNALHRSAVFNRRVRVLGLRLARLIPRGGRVLDLGCGDGSIALSLMGHRPDLAIEGADVLVRPHTHIPVTAYDGERLPFPDKSFDYVTIIDVLHHTDDAARVLGEAARVARGGIVLKDHLLEGPLAGPTLRFMDYVGNRGHDVRLPYNYLSRAQWDAVFARAGCSVQSFVGELGLYPAPFSLLFDRRLHFIALLAPGPADP